MGKSYKKTEKIPLNLKKVWEVPRGHQEEDRGCGVHNSKPRKNRTRRDEKRNAIKESLEQ